MNQRGYTHGEKQYGQAAEKEIHHRSLVFIRREVG